MGRPIADLTNAVNLSEKHLQAIGEVCVRWSELEESVHELVWELANLRSMVADAVTTHINEAMMFHIANSLVDLLVTGPEKVLAAEITDHLNFIKTRLSPARNAMVHSTWGHPGVDGKSEILPIKARGKLKIGPREAYSAEDISAIAKDMYEANEKLYGYVSKLRELIPKWNHIAK